MELAREVIAVDVTDVATVEHRNGSALCAINIEGRLEFEQPVKFVLLLPPSPAAITEFANSLIEAAKDLA